jgi:hypothetical protein
LWAFTGIIIIAFFLVDYGLAELDFLTFFSLPFRLDFLRLLHPWILHRLSRSFRGKFTKSDFNSLWHPLLFALSLLSPPLSSNGKINP